MKRRTKNIITPEEKLAQALVPIEDQPYSVPENWCWIHLGCISTNQYGYTAKAIADDNLPKMLRITDIQENGVDWEGVPNCEINDSDFAKYKLKENDIVIARIGATTGKCFLLDNPNNTVFASYLIRLRINSAISTKYVYSFLQSEEYWRQISDLSSGIALPGVNSSKLQTMKFPLAPIFEQQRIVDRIESLFAKLDEAKEKAQAVVDSFEDRKAAILYNAFKGMLTIEWRKARGTSINDWKTECLDNRFDITGGIQKTPSRKPNINPIPYITVANVYRNRIELSDIRYFEVFSGELDKLKLQYDDILVVEGNGSGNEIGRCAIWRNELPVCIHQNHIIRVRKKDNSVYPEYVLHYLNSPSGNRIMKEMAKTTAGLYNLSTGKIKSIPIPFAPIDEEIEIVRLIDFFLDKEQQAKDAAEQTLSQIDTMKKAILARAFRGELGTNDPTDESAEELLKSML